MVRPILIHVHIPKCAGTSFRRCLDASFPGKHLELYVNDTSFVYTPELLGSVISQRSEVDVVSSHFIRHFPPVLGGRPALYIAFLRDPVRRFLSYLTYIKKVYPYLREPELLRCVPQETPEMGLREMAQWVLSSEYTIPSKENAQVNFIAEQTWSSLSGYSRPASIYGTSRWDPDQFAKYRAVRLDLAKCLLSGFFFVGLAECMDVSLRLLRERCVPLGWTLAPGALERVNVSEDLLDDLNWIHPGDRVGHMLLESLREDMDLYHWAESRFFGAHRAAITPQYDQRFVMVEGRPDEVYFVENGMKRRVTSAEMLNRKDTQGTLPITDWELRQLPPGLPL